MYVRVIYGEWDGAPAVLIRHRDGRTLAFKYVNNVWGYVSPDDAASQVKEIGGAAFLRRWPYLRLPNFR